MKKGNPIHLNPAHKGRLHENLGVPAGQKIPAAKLEVATHSKSAEIRKEANFAKNAKKWGK